MAVSSRRAVLTAIGVISPIGLNLDSFWDSLQKGRSGVRPIQGLDVSQLPIRIAGEIPDFDAKKFIPKEDRRSLKLMARTIQLATAAAQLAMDDAGVDKSQLDPTRFGVEFGSGLIASELEEIAAASAASANCQPGHVDLEKWGAEGIPSIPPLWMLKYLPNMLACHVSILHNAQGPNNTVTQSEVAGLLAMGEAYRILGRNQADFFLVGGADSRLNPLSLVRQCLFQELSHRNDTPESASRPFDRTRDGWVIAEGSAVLALEELEHARRRNAKVYGEVLGFGAAFDRRRTGQGIARAIRAALSEAGIAAEDIDHINAHASGSVPGDAFEARGIHEVFGNCATPIGVVAPKSYLGNMGAAGGLCELIASILAFQHGRVPPTLNYHEPDPECPVTVIAGAARPVTKPYVLKTSCTDAGQCAALVVKRWSED